MTVMLATIALKNKRFLILVVILKQMVVVNVLVIIGVHRVWEWAHLTYKAQMKPD